MSISTNKDRYLDGGTTYRKTNVLIQSKDRIAGTPSEYWISLQPKLNNVVKIRFNAFMGGAFPYTFREDTLYHVNSRVNKKDGLGWTDSSYDILIPQGMYNLKGLMNLLNSFFIASRARFSYSETNHRVSISRVEYYYQSPNYDYESSSMEGQNPYVDKLLGFPRGWVLPAWSSSVPLAQRVYGIRSSYAVQPTFLPDTLLISLSEFPSQVCTSSGVIGTFMVPFTPRTFDFQSDSVYWSENSQFQVEIECYSEYINNMGVRILDSSSGLEYRFMEEHVLQLEVTHADTNSKPYPANNGYVNFI